MKLLEIENIIDSLATSHSEAFVPKENVRQAAVAAILRPVKNGTEALFILRSKKDGDPWSGQMAFPGGHYETQDRSLRETAERETLEEIGLDLVNDAKFVGKIADVQANPRGRDLTMNVSPFVFVLENQNAKIQLNYEVADVLWGSLNDMFVGTTATRHPFHVMGRTEEFPGYSVGNQVVWGLTLRMLDHFFTRLDPAWQPGYK